MGLESLLVRECIGIDSLQGIAVLIAAPVSAGDAPDLKSSTHELLRVCHVRTAAEIDEILTGIIDSDALVLGQIFDQLGLELLAPEELQRLRTGQFLLGPVLAALEDLTHLVLDHLEIVFVHLPGQNEIIVEAVRNLRSDCILYIFFSENLKYSFCQNVRQRVTINFQILFACHTFLLRDSSLCEKIHCA